MTILDLVLLSLVTIQFLPDKLAFWNWFKFTRPADVLKRTACKLWDMQILCFRYSFGYWMSPDAHVLKSGQSLIFMLLKRWKLNSVMIFVDGTLRGDWSYLSFEWSLWLNPYVFIRYHVELCAALGLCSQSCLLRCTTSGGHLIVACEPLQDHELKSTFLFIKSASLQVFIVVIVIWLL